MGNIADQVAAVVGDPDQLEVPLHQPEGVQEYRPKKAVDTMLEDERRKAQHANHAWSDAERDQLRSGNNLRIPKDKRRRDSGFDGRLPFKGPYLGYWVQNRKIFRGKTRVVQLKEVPEKVQAPVKRYPRGEVLGLDAEGKPEVVFLRKMIQEALDLGDKEILAADPLRCKFCIEFRGRSDIDLMTHIRRQHPKELDELVDGMDALRAEEEAQEYEREMAPEPAPVKKKQQFRASQ